MNILTKFAGESCGFDKKRRCKDEIKRMEEIWLITSEYYEKQMVKMKTKKTKKVEK